MDVVLYGHNPQERIVAIEQLSDSLIRMYIRGDPSIKTEDVPFFPFFYLSDKSFLLDFPKKFWIRETQGENFYRYLCVFQRWSDIWSAIHHVFNRYKHTTNQNIESYTELPIIYFRPDPIYQFLIQSGRTLFKGMTFNELHRAQLQIICSPDEHRRNILYIALSDNRGYEKIFSIKKSNEKNLIEDFINTINSLNPDVIEGHNILQHDLPLLIKKCEELNIDLCIGRNGSNPKMTKSYWTQLEISSDQILIEIHGRHIIDTFELIRLYDSANKSLADYNLNSVAQYFGWAFDNKTHIKDEQTQGFSEKKPKNLKELAIQNIRIIRKLSDFLLPNFFYKAQILPLSLTNLLRVSATNQLESLFIREYIRQKHSLPKPEEGTTIRSDLGETFYTGVFGPILHINIESIYPAVIISQKIQPQKDSLGVFLHTLQELITQKSKAELEMKSKAHNENSDEIKLYHNFLKILINSYFSYLGSRQGLFNDLTAANLVIQQVQKQISQLINNLSMRGAKVIAFDAEGIFLVPPEFISSISDEKHFIGLINATFPEGLSIEIEGHYKKMLSYKKKNYALLDYNSQIIIKGQSLLSRTTEKFAKKFISQCIKALLNSDIEYLHKLYVNLQRDIIERKIAIADLARNEILHDSLEKYLSEINSGKRNRSASYETALASGKMWKPGEQISYYITGDDPNVTELDHGKIIDDWDPNFPDENIPYYLRRLNDIAQKFSIFFSPQDFNRIFSGDDLFGFSAKNISLLTLPVQSKMPQIDTDEPEIYHVEPKIWLEE